LASDSSPAGGGDGDRHRRASPPPLTARRARHRFRTPQTGDGDNWRDRALAAGADAFVTKGGLDWAELLENIHNFVGAPPQKDRAEEV